MAQAHRIFVAGGTGYIGKRLVPALHSEGHEIIALVREESRDKLPRECTAVLGDALYGESYSRFVSGCDTFVQLVGVSHPSPAKSEQFKQIDLKAGLEAVKVARAAAVRHFVYVSVAQPAPVMRAYVEVRAACEAAILASHMPATVLRPWYVLGPGHRWPYLLLPLYNFAELLPSTRRGALRLGLVTIDQMVRAMVRVIVRPAERVTYVDVPEIRRLAAVTTEPAKSFVVS